MKLDDLLDRLDGVRTAGNGYVAICPAHDDNEASLGLTEGEHGKVLWKCHAGCSQEDVGAALRALLPEEASTTRNEPEAVYSYVDEEGVELFQSLRYAGKKFRQRHYEPSNEKADEEGWVWNLEDVRRVLYCLPDVLEAVRNGTTIYITEGEKDAESLRAIGKIATCNPMGAGKWRPEYAEALRGASTVIVVADRDEPGRNHAEAVRASLEPLVGRLWVVESKSGKDATDHLSAGLNVEDFKVIKKLRRGVVTAGELADHARERLEMTEEDLPGYQLVPKIPLPFRPGRMYAIGAYTGDGKTSLALQGLRTLASAGRRVGYFSLEMPEIDLVNRLVAHQGVPLSFTESPWVMKTNPLVRDAYLNAVEEIEHWQSEIVFDSAATAETIRERTIDREYEAIFVDHLHRIAVKDRHHVGDQVRLLTNIALELNVLVVVLCQLRKTQRGKDLETYPRPSLQDFRETSQIADDASMALAVWRQRDNAGLSYTGATEVIVLKNRHTTSRQDAAGMTFMPLFDADKQMFVA